MAQCSPGEGWMLEGMEERDGQEIGWPDRPRALGGSSRVEDRKQGIVVSVTLRAPGVWGAGGKGLSDISP